MKTSEAVEMLRRMQNPEAWEPQISEKAFDALEMAIDTLNAEPCEDAISRQEAKHALCKAVHKHDAQIPCDNQTCSCLWTGTSVRSYAREIDALPFVTPKPRTGKWLINFDGYYPYCSECKAEPKSGEMTDFCPSCGAKMCGGEQE